MYSPSKSYSYLSKKQPQNIVSFKQQTLQLLRQQSQKMKELKAIVSSKDQELIIKEEQIKFLKQTIRQMQNENQILIEQRNEYKYKVDKIVEQVKNYNQNVVKGICQQRQKYKKLYKSVEQKNGQLQKQLLIQKQQHNEQQLRMKQLQKQLQVTKQVLKQYQIKCLEQQQKIQKQGINIIRQQQQILRLQKLYKTSQIAKQRLQSQILVVNKQLSSVINKHNSSMKDYQIRIKQINNNKINIQEVLVYKQLVKNKQLDIHKLQNYIRTLNTNYQELKLKYLNQKQSFVKFNTQLNININQINTDILNLNQSIQLKKKIIQFQSIQSQIFYSIYQHYQSLYQENLQYQQKLQHQSNSNHKLSIQVQKLSESLKDAQIQQTLMKTQLQQQLQRLQSIYQGKLVSLNLKIKKQQQALQKLKKNQFQAMQQKQKLSHQLQTIQYDFISYKQTTQKSLQKLNNQNYQIVNQMQQIYKICQENVDNKRIVNKIKHILNALLTALYYFQLKIIRNKEKQKKIYIPILNMYLNLTEKINQINTQINSQQFNHNNYQSNQKPSLSVFKKQKYKLQQNKHKNIYNKGLKKFRVCAWVVISALRIKSSLQRISSDKKSISNSGIQIKILKALNSRNKIQNMSELLQKQGQCYEKSDQIQQNISSLLKCTQKVFKWQQPNFRTINLDNSKQFFILQRIKQQLINNRQIINQTLSIKYQQTN